MTNYILFCSQDANFQTRTMLIPYDKYLQCQQLIKDLDILRNNSTNKTFLINDNPKTVEKFLTREIFSDNESDYKDYYSIIDKLTHYADGVDECHYDDEIWYDTAICNLCRGYNHLINYFGLLESKEYKAKPIRIIESFLVIETDNGILRI